MLPEGKKREMRYSVLSLLKQNGMPEKGLISEKEDLLALTDQDNEENMSEEEKKKKKQEEEKKRPPQLDKRGVEAMKKALR